MADLDITVVANIEGLDELEEAFTEGSKRMVRKFLRRVEFAATLPLLKNAKAYARYYTGRWEEEIHRQTVQDGSNGSLTVRVGPSKDAFYAYFYEIGVPELGIPAEHWLENSAVEVQDQVLEVYMQAVDEGLQAMKKG